MLQEHLTCNMYIMTRELVRENLKGIEEENTKACARDGRVRILR